MRWSRRVLEAQHLTRLLLISKHKQVRLIQLSVMRKKTRPKLRPLVLRPQSKKGSASLNSSSIRAAARSSLLASVSLHPSFQVQLRRPSLSYSVRSSKFLIPTTALRRCKKALLCSLSLLQSCAPSPGSSAICSMRVYKLQQSASPSICARST